MDETKQKSASEMNKSQKRNYKTIFGINNFAPSSIIR